MNIQADEGLTVYSLLIQTGGWELYSEDCLPVVMIVTGGKCIWWMLSRESVRTDDMCMDVVLGKVVMWRELCVQLILVGLWADFLFSLMCVSLCKSIQKRGMERIWIAVKAPKATV